MFGYEYVMSNTIEGNIWQLACMHFPESADVYYEILEYQMQGNMGIFNLNLKKIINSTKLS